jgi:hypothetical protein
LAIDATTTPDISAITAIRLPLFVQDQKKTEYLQDLPQRKRTHITHRPRVMNDAEEDSMDSIAKRTLNGIPANSRY